MKKLYLGIFILVLASPLGLLAGGSAWGEWASGDIKKMVGYAPQGLSRLESLWRAPLSNYSIPGFTGGLGSAVGYIISGAVGVALIFAIFLAVGRFVPMDDNDERS